jgi:hypothetical protein
VPLTREIGEFGTLLAIGRAKQVLGYEPCHSGATTCKLQRAE